MSQSFKFDNFPRNNRIESGVLAADAESGDTTIVLEGQHAFDENSFIIVGGRGQESTELKQATAVSGSSVTIAALANRHSRGEPLTVIAANQIQVWRAAASGTAEPSTASYAKYGSPLDIAYDDLSTPYTDPTGGSGFWYRYTFLNTVTSAETSIDDSQGVRGGSDGMYVGIDAIRKAAGFEFNRNIDDTYISGFRDTAQSAINSALAGRYTVPFTTPVSAMIAEITKQYAAALLMLDQYGDDNTTGKAKMSWALSQIKLIIEGQSTIIDGGGTQVPAVENLGFSGYPNSSADAANGFMFERRSIHGFGDRDY